MDKDDPLPFTPEAVTEVLTEGGVPVEKAEKIQKNYEEYFEDTLPDAKELLDPKALKANEPRRKRKSSRKGGGSDKKTGGGRRHRQRREGSRHRRQGFPGETASGYLRLCGRTPLSGHPSGGGRAGLHQRRRAGTLMVPALFALIPVSLSRCYRLSAHRRYTYTRSICMTAKY